MEFLEFLHSFCANNIEITKRKNADYTGSDADIFSNFRAVAAYRVQPLDGFITRMVDKIARIETWLKGSELKVLDESGTDTLADLANYAMLLTGFIRGSTDLVLLANDFYGAVGIKQADSWPGSNTTHLSLIKMSLLSAANAARRGDIDSATVKLISIAFLSILIAYEQSKTVDING